MLTCISTTRAHTKCVSAFWAHSGLRHFTCKFLYKVALCISTAQARTKCGSRLGIGLPPQHHHLPPSLHHNPPPFHPPLHLPHIILIFIFVVIIIISIIESSSPSSSSPPSSSSSTLPYIILPPLHTVWGLLPG